MLKDEVFAILDELRQMSTDDMVYYDAKEDCKQFYYDTAVEELKYLDKPFSLPPYDEMSPLQKMCVYKISTVDYDADATLRSNIIYALAFSQIKNVKDLDRRIKEPYFWFVTKLETEEQTLLYRGDTMNSYATTVHKLIDGNNVETQVLQNYDSCRTKISENGQKFISLVHTLGNFIPVVRSFNTGRSDKNKTNDYWDLTMKGIYEYYLAKTETKQMKALESILKAYAIEDAKMWLDSFVSWEKFVEWNYLQPFVEKDKENKYGEPLKLWKGHSVDNKLPQGDQFEEFFKNTSRMIQERGWLIAEKVKEVLNSDTFKDDEFFERLTGKKADE